MIHYPRLSNTLFMSTTAKPIQQRSKLVIATLWVVLTLIVTRASTAIQSIFLSRVFSKEEVGLLSVMFMLNAGIHAFTELGHEAALIHIKGIADATGGTAPRGPMKRLWRILEKHAFDPKVGDLSPVWDAARTMITHPI